MFYKIKEIDILKYGKLKVKFETGEIKIFSFKKYIKKMKKVKKQREFKKVKLNKNGYGVIWNSGIELSSREIWKNAK